MALRAGRTGENAASADADVLASYLGRVARSQADLMRGALELCRGASPEVLQVADGCISKLELAAAAAVAEVHAAAAAPAVSLLVEPSPKVGSLSPASDGTDAQGVMPEPWPFWLEVDSPAKSGGKCKILTGKNMDLQYAKEINIMRTRTRPSTGSRSRWMFYRGLQMMVLLPTSPIVLVWTMLSFIAISYDLIALPLMAFSFRDGALSMATSIFWTCDFCFTFFVGYNMLDHVETDPRNIARRYLRSWLPIDFTIVSSDWISFIIGGSPVFADCARISRTVRIARGIRFMRLIRISKMPDFPERLSNLFSDTVWADYLRFVVTVSKLLLVLALICHIAACMWYWVATEGRQGDVSNTWLETVPAADADRMVYRYAVSFHWAFAQFTPSAPPVRATNFQEEVFNLTLLFVGLMTFASFLGSVTNMITQMRQLIAKKKKEDQLFKQFVQSNQIGAALAQKVLDFKSNICNKKNTVVVEKDVNFLALLPDSLLGVLRCAIFGPVINPHPLFARLLAAHAGAYHDLCHTALTQELLAPNTELFGYGSEASRMVFVFHGSMEYSCGATGLRCAGNTDSIGATSNIIGSIESAGARTVHSAFAGLFGGSSVAEAPREETVDAESEEEDNFVDFGKGQWLCEAAIWLMCRHMGRLTSREDSGVVLLGARGLQAVIKARPIVAMELRRYFRLFVRKAKVACEDGFGAEVVNLDTYASIRDAEEIIRDAFHEQNGLLLTGKPPPAAVDDKAHAANNGVRKDCIIVDVDERHVSCRQAL